MVKRTSSLASNQKFRVRFLVGLLMRQPSRRGSMQKGAALVKQIMLVRTQSSALVTTNQRTYSIKGEKTNA